MRWFAALTSGTLGVLAGLHVAWGVGSSFPCESREVLADTVAGTDDVPGQIECFAVAGALGAAALLVSGVAPLPRGTRRVGTIGVAGVLGMRGLVGSIGRTDLLVPWTPSERFKRLDRNYYGPLCLALAAGSLMAVRQA